MAFLCNFCKEIIPQCLRLQENNDSAQRENQGYIHLDLQDLTISARKCGCCNILGEMIRFSPILYPPSSQLSLCLANAHSQGRSLERGRFNLLRVSVIGPKGGVPTKLGEFDIPLYAEDLSIGDMRSVVCGKPPLESACTAKAYTCLNSWLERCNKDHDDCKKTLSQLTTPEEGGRNDDTNERLLPQRLLDVTPLRESGGIRLIDVELEYKQSQQNFPRRKGYVTLSYRWGEPPPPKALLSNIKSLEEGIPVDSLPKTFRDAVMVTRSINVRYIWIDSLCIVQDDPDELKREIAKMGDIYEGSTLTIGATHSENTTQGLFLPRQPVKSVQLPTISADRFTDLTSTSVYIRLPFLLSDCSPDSGHLVKRAWCFQEHLLSRRYVSFTSACLVWQCRALGEDETGLPESLRRIYSRRGWPEWALIVEQYSKRDMTSPDDKLNALAGYVRACGDAWNRGLYFNGVWADHYPWYLLWYGIDNLRSGSEKLNLPSWTWASKMGSVSFLFLHRQGSFELLFCVHGSAIIDDGKIVIQNAHILKIHSIEVYNRGPLDKRLPGEVHRETRDGIDHVWHTREIGSPDFEIPMTRHELEDEMPKLSDYRRRFCVRDSNRYLLGWASLDGGEIPTAPVYLLPVIREPKVYRDCSYIIVRGLLVCPSPKGNLPRVFCRVGVAIMLLKEWAENAPSQQITLV